MTGRIVHVKKVAQDCPSCDNMARAQAADRERTRREEIEKLRCLTLTIAKRLEDLIAQS